MLYAAIRKGLIRINGKRTALNYRTAVGDTLSIAAPLLSVEKQPAQLLLPSAWEHNRRNSLPQKKTSGKNNRHNTETLAPGKNNTIKRVPPVSDRPVRAPDMQRYTFADIPVLLKTTDLLIVNKPAGIPVHGSYSIDTILSGTSAQLSSDTPVHLRSGSHFPQSLSFKPGPLHRLDKDTTGILCFSRTLAGAQWFSQCLREKTADKYYLGIVRGELSTQLISTEDKGGKTMTQGYSLTYNKSIDASLMLFKLITGKKHQIRKHTASVGHPLIGDCKYRGGNPLSDCTRYQLHAWRLYFPASRPADIPAFIEAPLFSEMATCLRKDFPDWRKKATTILTNQTQAADNF